MKITDVIITESLQVPARVWDQAVQYVSGPMLPKPGGEYRSQDVLKRVKEIQDSIKRAQSKGKLDTNSPGYKQAVAELQKWDQWLQASQNPARLNNTGPVAEADEQEDEFQDAPVSGDTGAGLGNVQFGWDAYSAQPNHPNYKKLLVTLSVPGKKNEDAANPLDQEPFTMFYDGITKPLGFQTLKAAVQQAKQNVIMQQKATEYLIIQNGDGVVAWKWDPERKFPAVGKPFKSQGTGWQTPAGQGGTPYKVPPGYASMADYSARAPLQIALNLNQVKHMLSVADGQSSDAIPKLIVSRRGNNITIQMGQRQTTVHVAELQKYLKHFGLAQQAAAAAQQATGLGSTTRQEVDMGPADVAGGPGLPRPGR